MSDILIRGVEMPQTCSKCVCFDNEYETCQAIDWQTAKTPSLVRRADCPLIPVPKHGRLIDADALEHEFEKLVHQDNWYYNALHHAPAVIPATE